MGYQWVSRLAARHDVTLLTMRQRDKPHPAEQIPNARVVEWTDAKLFARNARLNSLLKPGYVPFYRGARRWIRAAQARGERFDVIHQLLPVAMRYPSPATGLGIPYLIGPVGGSLENPPGFEDDTAPWFMRLRGLDRLRMQRDPLLRRSYERADCVLGIAPYVEEYLDGLDLRRLEIMSETGLVDLPTPGEPRRLGRHGASALRRAARALEGAARRDPRHESPHELRPGRARRGRRGLRPGGVPGSCRRARPRGPGHLPRLAATRARGGLLPAGRRVRVPELSRARGQRDVRGHGLRAAADRHRPRRPRQRRRRLVRDPRASQRSRAVRERPRRRHQPARRRPGATRAASAPPPANAWARSRSGIARSSCSRRSGTTCSARRTPPRTRSCRTSRSPASAGASRRRCRTSRPGPGWPWAALACGPAARSEASGPASARSEASASAWRWAP